MPIASAAVHPTIRCSARREHHPRCGVGRTSIWAQSGLTVVRHGRRRILKERTFTQNATRPRIDISLGRKVTDPAHVDTFKLPLETETAFHGSENDKNDIEPPTERLKE
ncbi:hypothetical protein JCM7686_0273 [Paracoccus aminophilus JCM 7686]|uniref:Uncharacterized protein n=1 Tax=Paracoccus aminophilus JCM 7686 TaxID=1367847 RepID=S5XJM1_PARAH|nr:hypothetical protein JCM7686_0273 [Paracoccus aminophilus JCM 7686]